MIQKKPTDLEQNTLNLYFTKSARIAWEYLLGNLNIKAPGKILLPSYIGYTEREGSGVFDPVTKTGTPYTFYRLDKKLRPDIEYIKKIVEKEDIKLLVVIHYFGICQAPMSIIKDICNQNDIYLLEDCAHAYNLFNKKSILGTIGDFSFYSLHKYFAVADGGVLRINNQLKLSSLSSDKECSVNVLQQILKTDTEAIADKRYENYSFLYEELKESPFLEIMYPPQSNDVPHDFPILIKNNKREEVYFALMKKGYPTIALYYRMVNTIPLEDFPMSAFVSKNILNLPVHQDTNLEDLASLVVDLRSILEELN